MRGWIFGSQSNVGVYGSLFRPKITFLREKIRWLIPEWMQRGRDEIKMTMAPRVWKSAMLSFMLFLGCPLQFPGRETWQTLTLNYGKVWTFANTAIWRFRNVTFPRKDLLRRITNSLENCLQGNYTFIHQT